MKNIIVNKWLVWPSAIAWAFYPFIFVKDKKYITEKLLNHERIHLKQQKELLIVPFYLLYILNFLINIITFNPNPYKKISFEKEAFANENDLEYLDKRKFWSWTKYL